MGQIDLSTDWGVVSIGFSHKGIYALYLPGDQRSDIKCDSEGSNRGGLENAEKAASLLKEYFRGIKVDFSKIGIDFSSGSPFFRAVCLAALSIPYGEVRTYGELAQMTGRKGAARAVGRVMATNPVPIIIPCHRVVSSDGGLTGYSASGGLQTKKRLLTMEGVRFDERGTVACCK